MLKARKCVHQVPEYSATVSNPAHRLRLDLNESTTGCSPRVLARLNSMGARSIALYSPREPGEDLMADFLGLAPDQVLLTNGADEAIDLLCRAFLEPGSEIVFVLPAFSMYEIFGAAAGARVVGVPAGDDYSFPTERMLRAINPRTRMIVITNPNNPTGAVADRADILKIVKAAPDAAVLVDEAYFDFYGETVMDLIGKVTNLFVVRTFSKAYGLAGLRLGALTGAAEHMFLLRRICSPFNVNAFALECLAEALADTQFIADYVRQVRGSREWLRRELERLGFKCLPSHANFVLARFGEKKSAILAALSARGIALRDRPDCEGCVRITVGTQQEMEYLVSELRQVLRGTTAAVAK
ncbi:MAG TPA: histidinol-phosphate transaminase [Verrucomicrobiae bacterium]|nr:histidinol-phosphate transaminase [Verrucomicrobiae bacterium]